MRITAGYDGSASPFEGERTVQLRALPVDAQVTLATARLEPVGGPDFAERAEFAAPADPAGVRQGTWGAVAVRSGVPATFGPHAVEVRFHARRTLASVAGTGLAGADLLADLGGGFIVVNGAGGFGGTDRHVLADRVALPGL